MLLNGHMLQALESTSTHDFFNSYMETHGRGKYTSKYVEKLIMLILMLSAQGYTAKENTVTLLTRNEAGHLWETASKLAYKHDDGSGVPAILKSSLYGRNASDYYSSVGGHSYTGAPIQSFNVQRTRGQPIADLRHVRAAPAQAGVRQAAVDQHLPKPRCYCFYNRVRKMLSTCVKALTLRATIVLRVGCNAGGIA